MASASGDRRGAEGLSGAEREREVLRRAEIAAHAFGCAFFPYTRDLAISRSQRPATAGFAWSADWLRPLREPAPPKSPPLAAPEQQGSRTAPAQLDGAALPPALTAARHGAKIPAVSPRVPPHIAAVARAISPRRCGAPPPVRSACERAHGPEEGVPTAPASSALGAVLTPSSGGIEEGIPPDVGGTTAAASLDEAT